MDKVAWGKLKKIRMRFKPWFAIKPIRKVSTPRVPKRLGTNGVYVSQFLCMTLWHQIEESISFDDWVWKKFSSHWNYESFSFVRKFWWTFFSLFSLVFSEMCFIFIYSHSIKLKSKSKCVPFSSGAPPQSYLKLIFHFK